LVFSEPHEAFYRRLMSTPQRALQARVWGNGPPGFVWPSAALQLRHVLSVLGRRASLSHTQWGTASVRHIPLRAAVCAPAQPRACKQYDVITPSQVPSIIGPHAGRPENEAAELQLINEVSG
jgi:hypothetical protein